MPWGFMDLYLELYRDKIPNELADLSGADAFDVDADGLYWAVLTTAPAPGSTVAALLAPAGPAGAVQATTHGTDTLPSGATGFAVQAVCVWNPKEPPYHFTVFAPDGTEIQLDPPGSDDEHAWHCQPPPALDPIGIWTVKVGMTAAQELPASFGSIRAHLNPDDLTFTAASFEHQPLLRISGERRRDPRDCPRLDGLDVVEGCAPGEVTFRAAIENLDAAVAVNWSFGDGSVAVGGTPVAGGVEITHPYASAGDDEGDPSIASVTVVLPEGCFDPREPSTLTASVEVPQCEPPGCPDDLQVAIVSDQDCAPGTITFRASTTNDLAVELWTWNFDDGTDEVEGGPEITYTFEAPGPFDVTVAILKPEGCTPRQETADITVPACTPPPPPPPPPLRCPSLSGIEVDGCTPGAVTFTAIGENLDQPLEYQWGFGDGTGVNDGPSVSHTYPDGQSYTVAVTVRRPPGCPGPNPRIEAQVLPCRCPTLGGIEVDGCTPGLVTLTATGTDLNLADGFAWEFGDGATLDDGPSVTHTYPDDQARTATVTMRLPRGCPGRDPVATAPVSPCRPPIIDWCFIGLIVMLALFAIAAIATLVAGCLAPVPTTPPAPPPPPPTPVFWTFVGIAIGAFVLGVILYIIWLWRCVFEEQRCDLLQILVWVLRVMVGISFILALILWGLQMLGCAAGAAIDFAWLGILLIITEIVAEAVGCLTWPAAGARRGARR